MSAELLPAIEIETAPDPDAAVIWLHGLGDDGRGWSEIVPALKIPATARVRFLFPHAPVIPVTINRGYPTRAWYDIRENDFNERADIAGVKRSQADVEALGRNSALGGLFLPLGAGQFQAQFDAAAAVGGHLLDLGPGGQRLGPGGAAAILGPLPQDPGEAERLDRHEDGLTAEEDLVQAQAHDQRATGPVQNLKQAAGTTGILPHPAPQGGTTGQQRGRELRLA